MANYWDKALHRRVGRRRALAVTGAAALSAAFLAACGGDDDESGATGTTGGIPGSTGGGGSTGASSSGLVASYVDSTDRAMRGGIWQSHITRQPDHFDALSGTQATLAHTVHTYSTLLAFEQGTVFDPPDGTVEPDAAMSFEISPDETEVTLKLRPNNKFDERQPTNGRAITVEDVKFSFDRFAELSPNRGNVLNAISPDVPVLGLETPDESTIVIKLAHPDSSILSMLAWGWFLNIVPVEADGGFDMNQEMRGSGPWMMTDFEPSVSISYERNPNWWRANEMPYLDGTNYALLSETAAVEAQFSSGALWSYQVPNESVLPLKDQRPGANLYVRSPLMGNGGYRAMGLSKKPDSPLQDIRLRKALSMLIDRDLLNEIFGDIQRFQDAGIEVESAWHSHTPASWNTVWLDPRGDGLGEGAANFQYNPDEAASLLNAAGQFGMAIDYAQWSNMIASWNRQVEVVAEMLQEGGHFKLNRVVEDYRSSYQPKYNRTTLYDGLASFQIVSGLPDWNMTMWNTTAPGVRNAYINDWDDVPGLHEIMLRHRDASDPDERIAIAHEWQQLLASEMPYIPYSQPEGTSTFSMAQPWLQNFGVFRSWGSTTEQADVSRHYWYDSSLDDR